MRITTRNWQVFEHRRLNHGRIIVFRLNVRVSRPTRGWGYLYKGWMIEASTRAHQVVLGRIRRTSPIPKDVPPEDPP